MNAIEYLKKEHIKARAAFKKIETSTSGSQRGELWRKLRPELEVHEQMEEAHLYGPVARETQVDEDLAAWEQEHRQDVQEAETLINEISRLDPADEKWLEMIQKLREALEQHIEKEEEDIWPHIEEVWDRPRLEEAGRQMEGMKSKSAAA